MDMGENSFEITSVYQRDGQYKAWETQTKKAVNQ